MQVVVAVPERKPADAALPVLITMHGRGESFKGPARGARGWIDDYWLLRAVERLHAPPLTQRDFQGFADPERLLRINESLRQRPYRGLIVVCPFTPDILAGDRPFNAAEPLGRFLVDDLLPRVRRETPALPSSSATGVDGVSLGGRAALLVGLSRAKAFGAVAGLQAAFDSADADELARRAQNAIAENPRLLLRLLTSDRDYFLLANRNISKAFDRSGIKHELLVIPGPHDYEFNRGPGVYEMLLFHDRVLRGEAPL
jgi:enterochelin esterase-like enzyme